jgi:hypothetical protein
MPCARVACLGRTSNDETHVEPPWCVVQNQPLTYSVVCRFAGTPSHAPNAAGGQGIDVPSIVSDGTEKSLIKIEIRAQAFSTDTVICAPGSCRKARAIRCKSACMHSAVMLFVKDACAPEIGIADGPI